MLLSRVHAVSNRPMVVALHFPLCALTPVYAALQSGQGGATAGSCSTAALPRPQLSALTISRDRAVAPAYAPDAIAHATIWRVNA